MDLMQRGDLCDRSIVGRMDGADKKKKRRSNQKGKTDNSYSTENGVLEEGLEFHKFVLSNSSTASSTQCSQTMYASGIPEERNYLSNHVLPPSDLYYTVDPRAHPLPRIGVSPAQNSHGKEPVPYSDNSASSGRKFYTQHWSKESIDEALARGDVFKASFHVNAYNKVEAYCTIEGVDVDVLVNGISNQNRAVEGDQVAIELDPLSLWTKMKETDRDPSGSEKVKNILPLPVPDNHKGKSKLEPFVTAPDYGNEGAVACCSSSSKSPLEYVISAVGSVPLRRPSGKVIGIIMKSPRRESIVGVLRTKKWRVDSAKNPIQMIPNDPRLPKMTVRVDSLPEGIFSRLENGDGTVDGELIGADVVDWCEGSLAPEVRAICVFGARGEMEPHLSAILFENRVRTDEHELGRDVPAAGDVSGRRDFTAVHDTFTVDPPTASDLDDALSVERTSGQTLRVGVHISDASHFVLPGTEVDAEAMHRSRTVYLPGCRNVPMLPRSLSDGVVSLVPGSDRLAFSVVWDITEDGGRVLDRWVGRTVIRSRRKLSYDEVQDMIDGPEHGLDDLARSVQVLHRVALELRKKRFEAGALCFDGPKLGFIFDDGPVGVEFESRVGSRVLVEEFMILANTAVAGILLHAFPSSALLRCHPEPDARKVSAFRSFCARHGMMLDTTSSGSFRESLDRVRDSRNLPFDAVALHAMRAMRPAAYFCTGDSGEDSRGHYALAVPAYTHFTSPLRRYPDIVVHRMLAVVVETEAAGFAGVFTGLGEEDPARAASARRALVSAAERAGVPASAAVSEIAMYSNERSLAVRRVKEASDSLCLWLLLRKQMEVRINYEEVEGLVVEWLEETASVVLSLSSLSKKRRGRGGGLFKRRPIEDVAWIVNPADVGTDPPSSSSVGPCVFPIVLRDLSTVSVVISPSTEDHGPLDINTRFYVSSYLV